MCERVCLCGLLVWVGSCVRVSVFVWTACVCGLVCTRERVCVDCLCAWARVIASMCVYIFMRTWHRAPGVSGRFCPMAPWA